MDYLDDSPPQAAAPARRRVHSSEFKAHLVSLCADPAVSVAAIARAHHINDNMLHRWIKQANAPAVNPDQRTVAAPSFIAVPLPSPTTPVVREEPSSTICLVLQSKQFNLNVQWPGHDATGCAMFIRELLK